MSYPTSALHSSRLSLARFASALVAIALVWAQAAHAAPAKAEASSHVPVQVDPNLPAFVAGPPLKGELSIVGGGGINDDVEELVARWAKIFEHFYPLVQVRTSITTSGATPAILVEDKAQLGIMTRDMFPFETAQFEPKAYKYRLIEVPIAGATFDTKGFSTIQQVYVSKDNPIDHLSLTQLDAIFSTTRKRGAQEDIVRWGQVGASGDWADKPIHLYCNTKMPSGVPAYVISRVLRGGEFKAAAKPFAAPDDMAADKYGIGISAPGTFTNTKVIALSETDDGQAYPPTFANTLSRKYPLSRYTAMFLNQYVDAPLNPIAKEFLRMILTKEGQTVLTRSVLMPLPADTVKESLAALQGAAHGAVAPKSFGPYKLERVVAGVGEGAFDYVNVDVEGRHLFMARDKVRVVAYDLDTFKYLGEIPAPKAHGAMVDSRSGHGFASSGPITMFDAKTLKVIKTIAVDGVPDGLHFDPATQRLFVFSHKEPDTTAIDTITGAVVGTMNLGGMTEGGVDDGAGRMYVAIQNKSKIAVVDTKALRLVGTYNTLPGGGTPAGTALDAKNGILFVSCRTPQVMVIMNAADGRIITTLPIGKYSDGAVFNPKTMEAFSSNRDGTLDVIKEISPTEFVAEQRLKTKENAKTCALDLKTNRIITITADAVPSPPPPAKPIINQWIPGSFQILVIGADKKSSAGAEDDDD